MVEKSKESWALLSFYGQNTQIATPMLKTALRTEVGE